MVTTDTNQLSSLWLSELSVDQSRPLTLMQGPYVPLSPSTPIHGQTVNPPITDSAPEELPYQQVIPGIPQPSLYPSLMALGTSSGGVILHLYPSQDVSLMILRNIRTEPS